jgi:hypothetical protein
MPSARRRPCARCSRLMSEQDGEITPRTSSAERIERLQGEARRIREFLAGHGGRRSAKGVVRKSNVTDNESAKMATQKGMIQGYTAVAAVDEQAPIIVEAQVIGPGREQAVLLPIVEQSAGLRTRRRSSLPMRVTTARTICTACVSAACPP